MTPESARRLAMLTRLVEKAPGDVGRTALMKYLYFLTALRGVPLDYSFSLYSYGPFDADVLEDIDYAARLGGLAVSVEYNPVGYGYSIRPGRNAASVKALDADFVQQHEEDMDWVVGRFGHSNATELELVSTIVYVDKEGYAPNPRDVVERVHQIKPHFGQNRIADKLDELRRNGVVS